MITTTFAVIAVFVVAFGLISKWLEKTVLTPPIIFVSFGLLLSPQLLGLITIEAKTSIIQILAELTLILILFIDASRINFKLLRQQYNLPLRLLAIGFPITIILGTILGLIIFSGELNLWEVAVLATILAPTDAALAQAVVSSPRVPVCIRQAINVESGLNDGIGLPFLLIFLSLAGISESSQNTIFWLTFILEQILLGPVIGVAIGYLGGWLISFSSSKQLMNESFENLSVLALPLIAYSLAEIIGGNGFIASFCAGLIVGNTAKFLCNYIHNFGDAEGQLLILLTFMSYGETMVFPALSQVNWQLILYAITSLMVTRMAGVSISLIGTRLKTETVCFLGWFGPRGVASIIYGLLLLEEAKVAGKELIFSTMVVTVLMSTFAHGLTSIPFTKWYAKAFESLETESDVPELVSVPEMRVRSPLKSDHHTEVRKGSKH